MFWLLDVSVSWRSVSEEQIPPVFEVMTCSIRPWKMYRFSKCLQSVWMLKNVGLLLVFTEIRPENKIFTATFRERYSLTYLKVLKTRTLTVATPAWFVTLQCSRTLVISSLPRFWPAFSQRLIHWGWDRLNLLIAVAVNHVSGGFWHQHGHREIHDSTSHSGFVLRYLCETPLLHDPAWFQRSTGFGVRDDLIPAGFGKRSWNTEGTKLLATLKKCLPLALMDALNCC